MLVWLVFILFAITCCPSILYKATVVIAVLAVMLRMLFVGLGYVFTVLMALISSTPSEVGQATTPILVVLVFVPFPNCP